MKKQEFISRVAKNANVKKVDAEEMISYVVNTISDALAEGEEVNLPGFGKFTTIERAERNGVNPQTMEQIIIPAYRAPKFKAATALKELVR